MQHIIYILIQSNVNFKKSKIIQKQIQLMYLSKLI
jgi:hypothetical protein